MTSAEVRQAVYAALQSVAPEAELDELGEEENLREALDIDSFDFLNFLIGLNEALHVEIPESDYGKLTTLLEIESYLAEKTAGQST